MKLHLILVLLVLNASYCLSKPDTNVYLGERLIFFYEILHHVEQPLALETWIEQGQSLFLDKAYYTEWTEPMERFYQASLKGTLLPKDAFFGILIKSHQLEALGLYHFLVKPPAWEFFLQNACWARQHVHPHMFVYAFTRAVLERENPHELLPVIYEILPRHFSDWRFVQAAEKFVPSNWSATVPTPGPFDVSDWKPWQWWKMLGLSEEHWYAERKDILSKNIGEGILFTHLDVVSAWWRPTDYTRNMPNHLEKHSVLSYLTEDSDWNAYWHLVSVHYSPIVGGFTSSWMERLYAEHWIFSLEKFLARYYLERLSHGLGEIPEFKWDQAIKDGYDPELIAVNNQRFVTRAAGWTPDSNVGSAHYLKQIRGTLKYIEDIIDSGSYTMRNGTEIDLREQNSFAHIMNLLRGHTDPNGDFIESHWYTLAHMYFANMSIAQEAGQLVSNAAPYTMLNFETMARDPFFYVFHKEILKLRHRFQSYLKPYTSADLHTAGLRVLDVNISRLATFDDVFDFDVTNLLRTNLTVKKGRFIWRENLLARRARLNHRPFELNVTIDSDKHRSVLLRFYLGPKFDEYGREISLERNRHNFIELTNKQRTLSAGINKLHFSYESDFVRKRKNDYFQSKMYNCAVSSNCHWYMQIFAEDSKNCGLHDRLLLPRGWSNGLPMQLYVIAVESDAIGAHLWWHLCHFRVGGRSLGFPFDRPIPKEQTFIGPNMLLKDVKIFHEDNFAAISKGQHHTGEFFYPIFDDIDIEGTS